MIPVVILGALLFAILMYAAGWSRGFQVDNNICNWGIGWDDGYKAGVMYGLLEHGNIHVMIDKPLLKGGTEEMNKTKIFEFYWGDLTKECQDRLLEFLDGDNGNYDVVPLASLEIEEEKE